MTAVTYPAWVVIYGGKFWALFADEHEARDYARNRLQAKYTEINEGTFGGWTAKKHKPTDLEVKEVVTCPKTGLMVLIDECENCFSYEGHGEATKIKGIVRCSEGGQEQ